MSALFILVIFSILIAAAFLAAFIWSVKTDQFNDQRGAAMRMLMEEPTDNKTSNN